MKPAESRSSLTCFAGGEVVLLIGSLSTEPLLLFATNQAIFLMLTILFELRLLDFILGLGGVGVFLGAVTFCDSRWFCLDFEGGAGDEGSSDIVWVNGM